MGKLPGHLDLEGLKNLQGHLIKRPFAAESFLVLYLSLSSAPCPLNTHRKEGEPMSESRLPLPWLFVLFSTLAGVLLAVLVVYAEGDTSTMGPLAWASVVIGFAPLIGAQLLLGIPAAAQRVQQWLRESRWPLLYTAGGITLLWFVSNLLAGHFDPYATAIVAFGLFAALGTLRQIGRDRRGLTWADAAIWLFIWIPFDLRWNYDLWFGYGGGYNWWSIAISVLAVLGWHGLRDLPEFGYRLLPQIKDIAIALAATAVFAVIVIPIGLAIDFLQFPPSKPPQILPTVLMFVSTILTVAIPEELFFRGILQHGLDQMINRRWLVLLAVSFLFGLMHWNNADDLTTKIAYTALATLAGVFYGWTYRRSGNNLLAPVLTHALVDTIWAAFLQ